MSKTTLSRFLPPFLCPTNTQQTNTHGRATKTPPSEDSTNEIYLEILSDICGSNLSHHILRNRQQSWLIRCEGTSLPCKVTDSWSWYITAHHFIRRPRWIPSPDSCGGCNSSFHQPKSQLPGPWSIRDILARLGIDLFHPVGFVFEIATSAAYPCEAQLDDHNQEVNGVDGKGDRLNCFGHGGKSC